MILIPMIAGTATAVTFGICAVLAILGAVGVVTFTKPVYSALCLALVMISLAVIYASLGAPFLFAVQIIVYTGAVLMLFLFVIMLVGVGSHDSFAETLKGHRVVVAIAGVGVLVLLAIAVAQGVSGNAVGVDGANGANSAAGGNVQGLADLIFSHYVVAFEVTAALLITAAVAAMVMAHPEQLRKKVGQTDRAAARLRAFVESDEHPGPRPNSGVFARHNSVATPALLPDGSVAPGSVASVLTDRVAIASPEALWAPHDAILAEYDLDEVDAEELVDEETPLDEPETDSTDAAAGGSGSDDTAETADKADDAGDKPDDAGPAEPDDAGDGDAADESGDDAADTGSDDTGSDDAEPDDAGYISPDDKPDHPDSTGDATSDVPSEPGQEEKHD